MNACAWSLSAVIAFCVLCTGCGGDANKGMHRDKDKPKAVHKAEPEK